MVLGELILAHHLPCRACLQVTGASVPASEAVRIFVQFKDTDSSQRGASSASSTTPAGLPANNLLLIVTVLLLLLILQLSKVLVQGTLAASP